MNAQLKNSLELAMSRYDWAKLKLKPLYDYTSKEFAIELVRRLYEQKKI